MYYSLLFKCLIGVFNYNIFMESNLKQPRLFRVYFGKFRADWFAVYKYGGNEYSGQETSVVFTHACIIEGTFDN